MEERVIKIEGVSKTYSDSNKPALTNISLDILAGERLGLIGSNGSGKTTLLRLLMNFIMPDKGKIFIRDEKNLEKAHRYLGFVAESQEGMENFTPRELFNSAARMHGMNSNRAKKRVHELIEFSGLIDVADDLIAGFSKGMAQRTFISLALVHNPHILLLDEPMSGLDHEAQNEVQDFLKGLMDKTMIYASHNLEEIEVFTSTVVFLHDGRIVHQLQLNDLTEEIYLVNLDSNIKPLLDQLKNLNPRIANEDSETIELKLTATTRGFQDFLENCKDRGITIHRIRSRSILEDAYHQYIGSP